VSVHVAIRALQEQFEAVRVAELERLGRKLAGFSAADRAVAEYVIADVVRALGEVPEAAIASGSPVAAEALVRLFALDVAGIR